MQIDWDVEIPTDDGLVVRADVFRPDGEGRHPVLISYGPYAKGLHVGEGYPRQWKGLTEQHPEVLRGSSGRYANWETADPERWVPFGFSVGNNGLTDCGMVGSSSGRIYRHPGRRGRFQLSANNSPSGVPELTAN